MHTAIRDRTNDGPAPHTGLVRCPRNMKMATDLEYCEDEIDLLEDDVSEERDPNFVEERFRVDRRKLEQMLQGQDPSEGCLAILFALVIFHVRNFP